MALLAARYVQCRGCRPVYGRSCEWHEARSLIDEPLGAPLRILVLADGVAEGGPQHASLQR